MRAVFIDDYKGRSVDVGDYVHVYRNLHRDKLSIRIKSLVHGHAKLVSLKNVKFKVNENLNNLVRNTGQKNVHAFVEGEVEFADNYIFGSLEDNYKALERSGLVRVYYNPYKVNSFVVFETGKPIFNAESAVVIMDRVYITIRKDDAV